MIDFTRVFHRVVGSRLFKASSIYMVGYGLKRIVPFLLLPVMTAYLTPEDYAVVALFSIFIAIVTMVTSCGVLSSVSLEYLNKSEGDFAVYLSNCLLIMAVATGLVAGVSLLLSDWVLSLFRIPGNWLWTVFLVAICTNILNLVFYTFQAAHRPLAFIILLLCMTLIEISVSVFLVVGQEMHWQGRVIGLIMGASLMSIPALIWLYRHKALLRPVNPDMVKAALIFGLPLVPHYAAMLLSTMSDRLLLDHLATRTELGIYTVAFQLSSVVYILIHTFMLAWSPWFYEHLKLDTGATRRRVVLLTYALSALALLGGLAYGVSTWVLYEFMVDDAYSSGYDVAIVLSLAQAMIGLQIMISAFITFARKTSALATITLVTGVVNIAISYILIQMMGMMGAAIGTLAANAMGLVITWVVAARVHSMPWFGEKGGRA